MACLIPGLSISFEQPHKRTEITYFCLPKTIEALWNLLEKRRIVKTLPHQNVRLLTKLLQIIVFALALGALAAYFESGEEAKGYTLKTWMSLWRENGQNGKKKVEAKQQGI